MKSKAADATQDKRRQIIDGAALSFTRHGYEGASMAEIAAGAGVSKGTLYNYFACKSDLFGAFVEDMAQHMLLHLFSNDDALSPREMLELVGRRFLGKMLSTQALDMYRVVVSEAGQFPHLAQIFYDTLPLRGREAMIRWIETQAEAGEFQVEDTALAAEQFIALLQTRLVLQARLQLPCDASEAAIGMIADAAVAMFYARYGRRGPAGQG